jgi:hypothetical protein
MPSGDVAAAVPPELVTTQKSEPFQVMLSHWAADGRVRAVQVMPSGEVAAAVEVWAITQNTLPFHAMQCHEVFEGSVRAVHAIPSGEE